MCTQLARYHCTAEQKEKRESARAALPPFEDTAVECSGHSTHRVPYQNAQMLDGMFTEPLLAHALFVEPDVAVQPASLKSRQQA